MFIKFGGIFRKLTHWLFNLLCINWGANERIQKSFAEYRRIEYPTFYIEDHYRAKREEDKL